MVRAILEGRKTQTRRVVKPQPDLSGLKESVRDLEFEIRRMPQLSPYHHNQTEWGFVPKYDKPDCVPIFGYKCPYGQPGDRLWVRENWLVSVVWNKTKPKDIPKDVHVEYQATDESGLVGRKRPSIHMPRWASRITLEITGIRVERLNTINNADILREGIRSESCNICVHTGGSGCEHCFSIFKTFKKLWESINGPDSWDANPWVWVIEFKRVDQ